MALTKEVLLPVYEAKETALVGCAVLFTLDYADLLLERMEEFRARKEEAGTLHMSVYGSEYRGRFFVADNKEMEEAPLACMAHQLLISEFLETETSQWVVKPDGRIGQRPSTVSYVGVQWRGYYPDEERLVHSHALSFERVRRVREELASAPT